MATQRYISTSFWDDGWIHKLDPSEKLLYIYFLTNPLTNIAGVYQITLDRMIYDTGFNENTIRHILEKFEKAKKCFFRDGWLIIPSWPKHQKWKQRDKIRKGIDACLSETPKSIISLLSGIGYTYPIDTLSYPIDTLRYPSNYSDLDSDLDTDTDTDTEESPFSLKDELNPNLKNASIRIEHHRGTWNASGVKPPKQSLVLNCSDLLPSISAYSKDQIDSAIRNYSKICADQNYKPFPKDYGFEGFIRSGVEYYVDEAGPFDRCIKKTQGQPQQTEEERHRIIAEIAAEQENSQSDGFEDTEAITDPGDGFEEPDPFAFSAKDVMTKIRINAGGKP
jgi:hypothetical protein